MTWADLILEAAAPQILVVRLACALDLPIELMRECCPSLLTYSTYEMHAERASDDPSERRMLLGITETKHAVRLPGTVKSIKVTGGFTP